MAISYQQEVYRKLIHLSSLWMPAAMYFLPAFPAAAIFLFLLIGNVLFEYGYYKRWDFFYPLYNLFFGRMMRNSCGSGHFEFSGSPYVLASALLTVLCFKPSIAVCAFSVMLIGDTAAALVGRGCGRIKFANGKSLEGVSAFIFFGTLVLYLCGVMFHYEAGLYIRGAAGIALAAAAEFYEKKIRVDDNFSIALIVGIVMSLKI